LTGISTFFLIYVILITVCRKELLLITK